MPNLTPKQLQIVAIIRRYRQQMGISPTFQEMADEMGVSKVTCYEHVDELIKKGVLRRSTNGSKSRNLELVDADRVLLTSVMDVVDRSFQGKSPSDPIGNLHQQITQGLRDLPLQ